MTEEVVEDVALVEVAGVAVGLPEWEVAATRAAVGSEAEAVEDSAEAEMVAVGAEAVLGEEATEAVAARRH